MMNMQEIRIALIHANQLFRECLTCCLAQTGALTVIHNASTFEEAGEHVYKADILVVGFDLLHGQGISFVRSRPLSSECKTLIIDVPQTEEDVIYCIEKVGAQGYLQRDASLDALLRHIRAITNGEAFCSPKITRLLFCRMSNLAKQVEEIGTVNEGYLTKRETEIVSLIDSGLSNKEIAVRLQIEVSTVKNHVHNLLDKLQLHDRRSAARHIKAQGSNFKSDQKAVRRPRSPAKSTSNATI
jgi:two-component system, NarL family, nitrate/nitrite response regulator NarL